MPLRAGDAVSQPSGCAARPADPATTLSLLLWLTTRGAPEQHAYLLSAVTSCRTVMGGGWT